MGTSQSSKGPSSKVSLVPPWADDQPQSPLPEPMPRRFQQFRKTMSNYAKSGNIEHLKSSLGHYACDSTGGANIAVRRFGNIIKTGGKLVEYLGTGQTDINGHVFNLYQLAGKSVEEAISTIADNLTPINGDSDRIRTSINNALIEALNGVELFDPSMITEDIISDVLINYITENIFEDVLLNSGNSLNNTESTSKQVEAENSLHELISVVVDKKLSPKITGGIHNIVRDQITQIQRQAIIEVWQEWESYK